MAVFFLGVSVFVSLPLFLQGQHPTLVRPHQLILSAMTLFPYQIIFLSTGRGGEDFNLFFGGNTFQLITSYTLTISLLGIYPGEMKAYVFIKTYVRCS